jgi:Fe-S cluster assembly iron-binding protein IscA
MIRVTNNAKKELKKLLRSSTTDTTIGLRLALKQLGQFGLVLGKKIKSDQVVKYSRTKVLIVSQQLAPLLDGITLDIDYTNSKREFVIFKS